MGLISMQMSRVMPVIMLLFLFSANTVYAWENCPFGEINEPYPGTCGRYIDTDNDGICDLSQSAPEDRVVSNDSQNDDNTEASTETSTPTLSTTSRLNYFFIPIALVLSLLYGVTLLLSKNGKIKKNQHKKIWNVLLLITFLVSGIFGIILSIVISYGLRLSFYADLLFWHVEFGIAMAMISIFHLGWHWKYYKKMIIKNN